MALATLGINHRTASLDLREKIAFTPDALDAALKELVSLPNISAAIILSTCNRTELYLSHDTAEDLAQARDWLCHWHQVDPTALQDALYWYTADDAVRHAIEVASGLDSMVPGEPEILGQFKQASRDAEQAGALGGELHHLIQHTFAAAKKVRTLTEISRNPVSIAHVAVSLTKQFFDQLQERRALVIGAGEAARLVARYLNDAGIGHLTIANRSLDRAQKLARELLAHAIPMSHINHAMEDADIVISSTASPVPVLGKGMVEDAVRRRKHRPIYMVDLAVPRDIEPQIASLPDVYLYTQEDLRQVIEKNLQSRENARREASAIIDQQVEEFARRAQGESAFALIRDYRDQAQQLRDETLEQAQQRLKRGRGTDETLEWLAHTLCNRLTHHPTQVLNEAGQDNDHSLLDAARTLLKTRSSDS
ncbi:MAG: glutamyl-tRNA reductase [Gammaproteobacteria bacterium]|nr:glutamyl-tRNA reductase [Gammaproteobacteria bacterium]